MSVCLKCQKKRDIKTDHVCPNLPVTNLFWRFQNNIEQAKKRLLKLFFYFTMTSLLSNHPWIQFSFFSSINGLLLYKAGCMIDRSILNLESYTHTLESQNTSAFTGFILMGDLRVCLWSYSYILYPPKVTISIWTQKVYFYPAKKFLSEKTSSCSPGKKKKVHANETRCEIQYHELPLRSLAWINFHLFPSNQTLCTESRIQ